MKPTRRDGNRWRAEGDDGRVRHIAWPIARVVSVVVAELSAFPVVIGADVPRSNAVESPALDVATVE